MMFTKKQFLVLTRDRLAAMLLGTMAVLSVILLGMTALEVRPSDVQIPIRYSGFGFTNIYRDRWYALLGFASFGLVVFLVNGFLALKLHGSRRDLAVGILAISTFVLLFAVIVARAVFHLATFSL